MKMMIKIRRRRRRRRERDGKHWEDGRRIYIAKESKN